ncbi:MAG: hypothetical protein M1817_006712 [Caeruleum heppii]|nr:MAG: hypothetical protein M1817_006712 [Caeruleum heppii]
MASSPSISRNPSIVSPTSPFTSHRPSLDSLTASQPGSPLRTPRAPPQQHRNRAALRDYYGLKAAASGVESDAPTEDVDVKEGELDRPGFDAEEYVRALLEREGLGEVLRVEARLINGKKALVYDNYSKLIAATDTIRKMRTNMDPLAPTTSTLSPAIAHIADLSSSMATSVPEAMSNGNGSVESLGEKSSSHVNKQRLTVRWVLASPARIEALIREGRRSEAEEQWKSVSKLLDKWGDTKGVAEVRNEGEKALRLEPSGST